MDALPAVKVGCTEPHTDIIFKQEDLATLSVKKDVPFMRTVQKNLAELILVNG
jgi:hypothetical protein